MSYREHLPETRGYGGTAIAVNALIAVVATLAILWWASGFGPFYEELFRIDPTFTGANAGVGADWAEGNQIVWLDFAIAITHAADVIMGVFILFMVFLHWGAFRRLAARMRAPGESPETDETVAADGGRAADAAGGQTDGAADDATGEAADDAARSDGGDGP
ncbi:hypothetical protein [Halorarum salinum]|uniref:hypothetical protein n=1 Tax=Halorarum salinum TaxID=2743089 RepID=UPI001C5295AB|nr:hypothetical protein [Halobaculum salinum]